jgi:MOSC domain-containing protein YiiM
MRILSINTGVVAPLFAPVQGQQQSVRSAFHKTSVSSLDEPREVSVGVTGLMGDEQADRSVHGGEDKAIYAYPFEHYAFWQELITRQTHVAPHFEAGSFAENLTIEGFNESEVWVGDLWVVGSVEMTVVKLREPCFKFTARMNYKGAAKAMIQSARSGWYLRVRVPGVIKAGDLIKVAPGPRKVSIQQQNAQLLAKQTSTQGLFDE